MKTSIGLLFGLMGASLITLAKQISRDSKRVARTHRGSLTGPLPVGAVRIAGVGSLILAAIWLLN